MVKVSIFATSILIIFFLSVTAFNKQNLETNNQKANLKTERKIKTPIDENDVIGKF
ncbi:hypothetical protein V8G61_03730 [Gaetbulibacter sp. M240]|uniref:hypothetical protein n=1 Tax=Gaetbulibacter sp. M240 TaxID=3126511 RepID=UPI00374F6419